MEEYIPQHNDKDRIDRQEAEIYGRFLLETQFGEDIVDIPKYEFL